MVKNFIGGSKNKKIARKSTNSNATSFASSQTKFSTNEFEEYALVTKMYGNGRIQVKTHTNRDLQCVIRNKFRGRSKHSNIVHNGGFVLVGLREWEKTSGYKTCDLLEIYSPEDVLRLKNNEDFKVLIKSDDDEVMDDIFEHTPELDETGESNITKIETEDGKEISFDDI